MKKISMLSLILMGAFAVSNANASIAITSGQGATATMKKSLSATTDPVQFGTLITTGTGGTVVLKTDGSYDTLPTSIRAYGSSTGTAGSLTISGEGGTTVTLTKPGEALLKTGSEQNASSMTASTWTLGEGATENAGTISVTIPSTGSTPNTITIPVGASLVVGDSQADGTYTTDHGTAPSWTITY